MPEISAGKKVPYRQLLYNDGALNAYLGFCLDPVFC